VRADLLKPFTGDLEALREWFKEQQVRTVAMEATGVYWLYLYEVLEAAGLEVVVVNGRHVQNVPGRKTDMADCQWLATLHAHGLLRGGFVPPAEIRQLQDYQRLRADHLTMAGSHEQHMQKALERMNLKIHDVISDLTGVSGLKVVRAILKGERRPGELLALCDEQIQKKRVLNLIKKSRGVRPATPTKGLGLLQVWGRIRVPQPAMGITIFMDSAMFRFYCLQKPKSWCRKFVTTINAGPMCVPVQDAIGMVLQAHEQ
jgi:hypothetical protein